MCACTPLTLWSTGCGGGRARERLGRGSMGRSWWLAWYLSHCPPTLVPSFLPPPLLCPDCPGSSFTLPPPCRAFHGSACSSHARITAGQGCVRSGVVGGAQSAGAAASPACTAWVGAELSTAHGAWAGAEWGTVSNAREGALQPLCSHTPKPHRWWPCVFKTPRQ